MKPWLKRTIDGGHGFADIFCAAGGEAAKHRLSDLEMPLFLKAFGEMLAHTAKGFADLAASYDSKALPPATDVPAASSSMASASQ